MKPENNGTEESVQTVLSKSKEKNKKKEEPKQKKGSKKSLNKCPFCEVSCGYAHCSFNNKD